MSLARVDVLVAAYNEEPYVERCLACVLGQDYPRELVSVWLIDGGSTDRTVSVARALADTDPRLHVIAPGSPLNLPEALNLGIAMSDGDLLAKVDAHGYPEQDFLRRAVEAFISNESDVACVGGRPEQEGETRFGRALARARTSRFGVGESGYAGTKPVQFVDTVQCGIYRREPLIRVGMFDPKMRFGEDEEVNWRLRQAGYRILLDTGIRFHYLTRRSWRAAYRQYRNYGEARVRVVRKHPEFLRPHHLVPAGFVAAMCALGVASPFLPSARSAFGGLTAAYLMAAVAAAFHICRPEERRLVPWVAAAYTALHMGYGAGMLRGLWKQVPLSGAH